MKLKTMSAKGGSASSGKKLLICGLALTIILGGCSLFAKTIKLDPEEAKTKALEFINENLVSPDNQVTIKEITEESGVFKLTVVLGSGDEVESYMTFDGKTLFTQGIAMETEEKSDGTASSQDIPKNDKPVVELFVMSHCPYGTQIEKGILPVLNTLGDKIDFQLKFVNYAMHGITEIDEELNQYCIQKNQPDKLKSYLSCFLEEGDGENCLSRTDIDQSQLKSCVKQADSEFNITANYEDESTWMGSYPPFDVHAAENEKYGVQGSPTLIINETEASAGRDSASLLAAVCGAFNTIPEECSTELDSTSPAPGFGYEGSGSGAEASCGG